MIQFACHISVIACIMLPFQGTICAQTPNDKTTNAFFAMDTIARGRLDVVVPMLKELGYDGLGGAAGDGAMSEALEREGLKFFNAYITLSFDDGRSVLDQRLKDVIRRMESSRGALWLAVAKVSQNGKPVSKSSTDGDEIAIGQLREIAEFARPLGVKVALYPHAGFWIERFEDAVRVAGKLDRDDIGVTFNLCHWLKVEGGERDPLPLIKAALPRLMFVTINGADAGDTKSMGWDRLIQPLGRGSYDVASFMSKVRAAGYAGPIGFQGYGIKEDPKTVLTETMAAWRRMTKPQ